MRQLLLVLVIALVCYLVVPGLGAVAVRRRWRWFRARVTEAARLAFLSPHIQGRVGIPLERLGVFRFAGALEAIQGQDTVWLRGAELSVAVRMDGERVCMVPSEGEMARDGHVAAGIPTEPLQVLRWPNLHAIAEGTGFYVVGPAHREHGKLVFKGEAQRPLLVLIYDGDSATVLERALWYGRQQNEYWNPVTPPALVAGAVLLAWFAYQFLAVPPQRIQALLAVVLASVPILPLLPPGVLFLLAYRRLWRLGRVRRAQRDMLIFNHPGHTAPAREKASSAMRAELASLVVFVVGLGLNAVLLLTGIGGLLF